MEDMLYFTSMLFIFILFLIICLTFSFSYQVNSDGYLIYTKIAFVVIASVVFLSFIAFAVYYFYKQRMKTSVEFKKLRKSEEEGLYCFILF